ncbi:MAG: fasciclin domain-containing protein [Methanotrichaceae archaeon]
MDSTKITLFILILATALLSAGLASAAGSATASSSILDASKALNLTTFSMAVQNANISETLNNRGVIIIGNGSFIVFAPSDAAFAAMAPGDLSSLMENQTDMKRVLSYHVIWNDSSLGNISSLSSVETLEGENLSLNSTGGLKVNGANVLQTRNYDNGTIYVIDKVLMPKQKGAGMSFVDAANKLSDIKTFAGDIQSAGLVDNLNGQGLFGLGAIGGGPYTIFAPSDAAFSKAPAATIKSISANKGNMMTLLSYHIVESKAVSNNTGAISVKTLEGSSLAIDTRAKVAGGANVTKSKRYSNGIIYEIDQVLIPLKLSIGM